MKPLIVTSLVDGKVVVRKKIKEPKLIAMETKNINYKGTTDGFIVEIKEMAWTLVSLKRPEELFDKNQEIDTLGGFIFFYLGRIPGRGEVINYDKLLEFTILEADTRKIKRILVSLK